jgi:hypothetical protein
MPLPHLLTRTFASPACVSQMPLTSAAAIALVAGKAKAAARTATTIPNLEVMEPPKSKLA